MTTEIRRLDTTELEERVKRIYEEVALDPEHEFPFETGRPLTERLGYPPSELDRILAAALDSFAGVGYREAIEAAGFTIETWRENSAYRFVSGRADNATQKYGVTTMSLLARRS
jgi:hypothetical protein